MTHPLTELINTLHQFRLQNETRENAEKTLHAQYLTDTGNAKEKLDSDLKIAQNTRSEKVNYAQSSFKREMDSAELAYKKCADDVAQQRTASIEAANGAVTTLKRKQTQEQKQLNDRITSDSKTEEEQKMQRILQAVKYTQDSKEQAFNLAYKAIKNSVDMNILPATVIPYKSLMQPAAHPADTTPESPTDAGLMDILVQTNRDRLIDATQKFTTIADEINKINVAEQELAAIRRQKEELELQRQQEKQQRDAKLRRQLIIGASLLIFVSSGVIVAGQVAGRIQEYNQNATSTAIAEQRATATAIAEQRATATAIAEQRATATAIAEQRATATAIAEQRATATAQPIFDEITTLEKRKIVYWRPSSGSFIPKQAGYEVYSGPSNLKNFVIDVRFYNATNDDDFNIGFRANEQLENFRLVLRDGWKLYFISNKKFNIIKSGTSSFINKRIGESNLIRLYINNEIGQLFINDKYITDLNLSVQNASGSVWIGIGVNKDQVGQIVKFDSFTVWSWE